MVTEPRGNRPIARAADYAPPASLGGLQSKALVIGGVGSVVALAGLFFDRAHFFQAYLVAYVFWLAVALGATGLMMLHHLSRGAWGIVVRRPMEAAARTLPALAVLFVPLVFGLHDLYHWTHAEAVAADPILTAKEPYLNVPFFLVRAGLYFAVWIFFAWRITALSHEQDETGDPAIFRRLQGWSGVGFLVYALTMTFAAVDWVMSIDPHWFSSLYGLWFFAGTGLSGLVFIILVAAWLAAREPMRQAFGPRHFHDYGKLFFAFTMLWAYLTFSQMLLIWSGNLPEEITFYLPRLGGGWILVSVVLLLGHFILPFLILLSASLKQRPRTLAKVAVWMLAMRWLDIYWNVAPTLAVQHGGDVHLVSGLWIDLAAVAGLGGLWLFVYFRELRQRPLLPVNDPFLPEYFPDQAVSHG